MVDLQLTLFQIIMATILGGITLFIIDEVSRGIRDASHDEKRHRVIDTFHN